MKIRDAWMDVVCPIPLRVRARVCLISSRAYVGKMKKAVNHVVPTAMPVLANKYPGDWSQNMLRGDQKAEGLSGLWGILAVIKTLP
jgi:hypothetical protein